MKKTFLFTLIVILVHFMNISFSQNTPTKYQREYTKFPKKYIFDYWETLSYPNTVTLIYISLPEELKFKFKFDTTDYINKFTHQSFDYKDNREILVIHDIPQFFRFIEPFDTLNADFKIVDYFYGHVYKKGIFKLKYTNVKIYILEYNNIYYEVYSLNNSFKKELRKMKKGELIHLKITDICPFTSNYSFLYSERSPELTYIADGYLFHRMDPYAIYKIINHELKNDYY
jgi:hypothetical protein